MSFIEEFRRRIRRDIERFEEEVREIINEVFEEVAGYSDWANPMWDTKGSLEPLYSIYRLSDRYIIRFDLAGADLSSLTVEARDHILVIKARLSKSYRFERWGTVQKEISFREYRKELMLPEDAEPENMRLETHGKIVDIIIPRRHML